MATRESGEMIVTLREAAASLKRPVSTSDRFAARRELPGHNGGRQRRLHKATLEDWLSQKAERARAEPPEITAGGW